MDRDRYELLSRFTVFNNVISDLAVIGVKGGTLSEREQMGPAL